MIDQIESQMITLKLHGMRESYSRRCKQAGDEGLAHEDCVGMLVQDEVEHRKNTRIQRLLKNAAFRQPASVEGVDFSAPRGLDKKQIAGLAGGRFIRDGLNVVAFSGPSRRRFPKQVGAEFRPKSARVSGEVGVGFRAFRR